MTQNYNLLDFLKTFGVNTTTNFDLYSIAKFLDLPLEIYMKNEIPEILSGKSIKVENIIFNYQTTNQNGTHWTCYSRGYYFDSFGLKPLDEIEKHTKVYNKIQVQHFNTEICGILCIYFLYKIHNRRKLTRATTAYKIILEMKDLYDKLDIIKDYKRRKTIKEENE